MTIELKRGSILLQSGMVYEFYKTPIILAVAFNIVAEQSSDEIFTSPVLITFNADGLAIVNEKFLRVGSDVEAAIKKDPFIIARKRKF